MQPPRLKYTIEVFSSLAVTNEDGELAFSEEKIKLGDFQRNAKSDMVMAELVGDLVTFQNPPSLENKVLLLPKYEKFDLSGGLDRTHQLLIDREQVSFDGSQCNKVGTSFTAF